MLSGVTDVFNVLKTIEKLYNSFIDLVKDFSLYFFTPFSELLVEMNFPAFIVEIIEFLGENFLSYSLFDLTFGSALFMVLLFAVVRFVKGFLSV